MKKGKYVLLIFLIFFFLLAATTLSFVFYEFKRPPEIKTYSYLDIDLSGSLPEFAAPDFWTSFFLGTKPLSVHDFWENFRKAKKDNRIRCLLLRLGYFECDWGKISELRDAILDFRESGKKVYAYIGEAPEFDKGYYLATACDRIILHPMGWLGLSGVGGWVPFFKEGLDKLGVEADYIHVEQYKTAYNMFTEKGFTKAHRTMLESIYSDIFSRYVRTVAEARKKTEEEVRGIIDTGLYQGDNALKAGLVDDLLYEDELEKLLQDKGKQLQKARLPEYARVSPSSLGLETGRKIALLYAMGPIVSGEGIYQMIGSRTLSRWIRNARLDKSIAAIVLRVDSPGGSAVASDVIWREVALAKKEKPFVVSMSDMAGSGGYWISMDAHKIVAQPQTLTGSIGVLFIKFSLARLYEKLGITAEKLAYGKRADMFSSFRAMTPEEKEFMKKEILWSYDQFLTKAAEGRDMTKEEVDKVGQGRVWTGSQAKEIKLVDELGGLSKALEIAKNLSGIPADESVRLDIWPKKTSFFSSLFGRPEIKIDTPLPPDLKKLFLTLKALEKEKLLAVMSFWLPAD
jgi:protease-4